MAHLEPAGSITQVWGLSIQALKAATCAVGTGRPSTTDPEAQVGCQGEVCRERSQSQSSSCWESCVHTLPSIAPP